VDAIGTYRDGFGMPLATQLTADQRLALRLREGMMAVNAA
jgi:hypothetical protein